MILYNNAATKAEGLPGGRRRRRCFAMFGLCFPMFCHTHIITHAAGGAGGAELRGPRAVAGAVPGGGAANPRSYSYFPEGRFPRTQTQSEATEFLDPGIRDPRRFSPRASPGVRRPG